TAVWAWPVAGMDERPKATATCAAGPNSVRVAVPDRVVLVSDVVAVAVIVSGPGVVDAVSVAWYLPTESLTTGPMATSPEVPIAAPAESRTVADIDVCDWLSAGK